MKRKELLEALLVSETSPNRILSALAEFGWDCEDELVRLDRNHIISILRRFRKGEISDEDVSDWADAVEGRDDIGFEEGCEEILTDVIYELANPELTRPLSSETADEWICRLKSYAVGSEEKTYQEQMSDINVGRKKRLIPIDEELLDKLTKISESEHIPPEALIDLWLKEKISETHQQM